MVSGVPRHITEVQQQHYQRELHSPEQIVKKTYKAIGKGNNSKGSNSNSHDKSNSKSKHSNSNSNSRDSGKSNNKSNKDLEMKCAPSNTTNSTSNLDGLSLIQRGNEYFFSNCYLEATGYYYQAAMLLKGSKDHRVERSKAWSNVAECHLRLQNWQAAQDAASNAVITDPNNAKALYRRAKARFELGDYAGAAKDADAVGTRESRDVAELCRELAQAALAKKKNIAKKKSSPLHDDAREDLVDSSITESCTSNSNPFNDHSYTGAPHPSPQPRRRPHRGAEPAIREREPPPAPVPPARTMMSDRELWFRRLIDSYRLRVDDEYTTTGAADGSSLYGIRAKGGRAPPFNHFRSYVQRALKKRVLPLWFTLSEMDPLCHLATTDAFSNISVAGLPDEIHDFYTDLGFPGELSALRDLASYIEGPIGMPWDDSKALPPGEKLRMFSPSFGARFKDKPLPNIFDLPEKMSPTSQVLAHSPALARINASRSGSGSGEREYPPHHHRQGHVAGLRYPPPPRNRGQGKQQQQQDRYTAAESRDDQPDQQHHHYQEEVHHGYDRHRNHYDQHHPAMANQQGAPISSGYDGKASMPPYAPVNSVENRSPGYDYDPQKPYRQQQDAVIRHQGSRPTKEDSPHSRRPHKNMGHPNTNPGHRSNLMVPQFYASNPYGRQSTYDETEATSASGIEQGESFGPQLPYRMPAALLPGHPVTSANSYRNQPQDEGAVPIRNNTGDNNNGFGKNTTMSNEWPGPIKKVNEKEYYCTEETSSVQSVRHGVKDDMRDEVFSELTELSP